MSLEPDGADLAAIGVFALELAEIARRETLGRWASRCPADDKGGPGGFDPVTEADREAERAMRTAIEARFPDHGILGEEFPERPAGGRYSWSLDPVDGTRSFICGLPTWVTLIALLEDGIPRLGLIDAPRLDELYFGFRNGRLRSGGREEPLRTSACRRLADARLSTTDPYLLEPVAEEGWERLRGRVRTTRYGHDGYAYARLAAGSLDLVVETGLMPYDYHALIPVVRSAGGVVGDWKGGEDFAGGSLIAAATRELYEAAAEAML